MEKHEPSTLQDLRQRFRDNPWAFAIVVAGPSGAGKTSICQEVLAHDSDVRRCVTTTTRPRRSDEVDGVMRHFVSEETFADLEVQDAFVEQAIVHGFRYGATFEAVIKALSDNRVMLMDVDVQGVESWKQVLESHCVTVFVLPPSLEELEARLKGRQTEEETSLKIRLENAIGEMRQAGSYDYVIVNDDLDRSVADFLAIIRAERSKASRKKEVLPNLGISESSVAHH